jgi:DNA recombination protein RmuC
MEPVTYLGILIIGLLIGGIFASLLVKGSRGPNFAAGEAEVAEFKARIEERDQAIKELRHQVDIERASYAQLQTLHTEAVAARAAADERALAVPKLEGQLEEKERTINVLNEKILTQESRHASLMTRLDETGKAQAEKLRVLEETQQKLADTFRGAAAEALAANNENFLTLARGDQEIRQKALEDTLKPLRDKLEGLQKDRVESFAGLSEQFRLLQTAQAQAAAETSKLANALRAPSVRGRWGEMQLRRVVEMAGMVEYCDFEQQVTVDSEGGKLRPDMIIRLPNHREIIVDSKVSLAAYLDSLELADDGAREAKLVDHASQVRQHVQRLAGKAYWEQFREAPDFVVAFLPGETFFSAALQKDPELIEYGVENRVLLATPTTLIALLKAVAFGWRQEKLTQNAQEISDLGKELYDRLRVFAGHMDGVRSGLERSVESYNRAAGSLESRVLVSARRFKELSAATGEDIPQSEAVERTPRPLQAPAEAPQAPSHEAPRQAEGLALLAAASNHAGAD